MLNISLGEKDSYFDSISLTCKKCAGLIYGCNSCLELRSNSDIFLQCNKCDDGLYLLKNQTFSSVLPDHLTFCVPDCKLAHNAFINNPITGECTFCGADCSSCNQKYGCELCQSNGLEVGKVNAIDYTQKYYNGTFKKCSSCQNTKKCLTCSSTDLSSCEKCNSTYSSGSSNSCVTNSKNQYLDNCDQASSSDSKVCAVCSDGYFVNFANTCSKCNIDNCLECSDSTFCTVCASGYSLYKNSDGKQLCYDCNKQTVTAMTQIFPDCDSCSIDTSTSPYGITCLSCKNGYINQDLTPAQCDVKCPQKKYGKSTFGDRGRPTSTKCEDCDTSCENCVADGASYCSSCPKGYYMQFASTFVTYGICVQKDQSNKSINLFVTPEDQSDVQNLDGSFSQPFPDLMDAVVKSYEFCADVTDTCNVNIYLLKGVHYLLNYDRDFFQPQKLEIAQQTMKLTVQPLVCDGSTQTTNCVDSSTDQITIYNKRRENMQFLVSQGLTIKNIIFDSLDSIIDISDDTTDCLKTKTQCCKIDSSTVEIIEASSTTTYGCTTFRNKPSDKCLIANGPSLFKFDISHKTVLQSPSTLTLDVNIFKQQTTFQGVIFKNILFDYNTLIEMNHNGGHVIIKNSQFQRISNCGSIIRNFKALFAPDTSQLIYLKYPQVYQIRNNILQFVSYITIEMYQQSIPKFSTCGSSSQSDCYSITIEDTTFTEFGKDFRTLSAPVTVNKQFGLVYQARILNLQDFQGDIVVKNSVFNQNILKYSDCQQINSKIDKLQGIGVVDSEYPIYLQSTDYQAKSLFVIMGHSKGIKFINNTFEANSALGSIIKIDVQEIQWNQNKKPILFYNNTFKQNAAYFGTNLIKITSQRLDNYTVLPQDGQTICGGILISDNQFTQNFGCAQFGGSLFSLFCVPNSYDSDDYKELPVSYDDADFRKQLYQVDYTQFTITNLTQITEANNLEMDMNKIEIRNNKYKENFAGYGRGMIDFIGIQRIYMINEEFINNGENTIEVVETYKDTADGLRIINQDQSLNYSAFSDPILDITKCRDFSLICNSRIEVFYWMEGTSKDNYLLRAMIFTKATNYIYMKDVNAYQNYVYEPKTQSQKASFLYMERQDGEIAISNVTIASYSGVVNNFTVSQGWIYTGENAIQNYDNGLGTSLPLIACHESFMESKTNCQISALSVDSFKVKNFMQIFSATMKIVDYPTPSFFFLISQFQEFPLKHTRLNELEFQDIDCILCDQRSMFRIDTFDFSLSNSNFTRINQQLFGVTKSKYGQTYDLSGFNNIFTIIMRQDDTFNTYNPSVSQNISLIDNCLIDSIIGKSGVILRISSHTNETMSYNFNILNTQISNSFSFTGSTLLDFQDFDESNILIDNLQVHNSSGLTKGVLIMVTASTNTSRAISSIQLQNSKITDVIYPVIRPTNQQQGWALHVNQNADFNFTSIKNEVDCNSLFNDTDTFDWTVFTDQINFIANLYANNQDFGSLFYLNGNVSGNINVASESNKFKRCVLAYRGSVYNIQSKGANSLVETSSEYQISLAGKGGSIYCLNCQTLELSSPSFSQSTAYQGGALFFQYTSGIQDTIYLRIDSFTINECHTLNDAAFMYFDCDACTLDLTIVDTNVTSTSSNYLSSSFISADDSDKFGGGFLKINAKSLIVDIDNAQFLDVESTTKNGGVILVQAGTFSGSIKNSQFIEVTALENGGIIYAKTTDKMNLTIYNNLVSCRATFDENTFAEAFDQLYRKQTKLGSTFYFSAQADSIITSELNQYNLCFVSGSGDKGGGAYNLNSKINLKESHGQFTGIAAIEGGIYYCDGCNIQADNMTYNQIFSYFGSIVYATTGSDVQIINSVVNGTTSIDSGGIIYYVEKTANTNAGTNNIFIDNCTFTYMTAYLRAAIMNIMDVDVIIRIRNSSMSQFGLDYQENPRKTSFGIDLQNPFALLSIENCTIKMNYVSPDVDSPYMKNDVPYLGYAFLYSNREGTVISITNSIFSTDRTLNESFVSQKLFFNPQQLTIQGKYEMLSMIYIEAASSVEFSSNTVRDSYLYCDGLIYIKDVIDFIGDDNTIERTASNQGGAFTFDETIAILRNNIFRSTYAQTSGAICHMDGSQVQVFDSLFQATKASLGGGVMASIRVKSTVSRDPFITFTDCTFINNTAMGYGGAIYLNNFQINLKLIRVKASGNSAVLMKGGFLYTTSSNSISFDRVDVSNAYALSEGKIMNVEGNIQTISINNSNFVCDLVYDYDMSLYSIYTMKARQASGFYLSGIPKVQFYNNTFSQCNSATQGGVLQLVNTASFVDSLSKYTYNSALSGGVIKASSSKLNMTNCSFTNNQASEGGVAILDNNAQFYGDRLQILENIAINEGGGFMVLTKSFIQINNSDFSYNYATSSSAISILGASTINDTIIQNTKFWLNEAETNTIFVMYAPKLYFINCDFRQNKADSLSKNIFMGFSSVYINNTIFRDISNDVADRKELQYTEIKGSHLHVIMKVDLYIQNSQFLNGKASQGGAIYISGESNITIKGSTFDNNKAYQSGGAIYASSFLNLYIMDSSIFKNNYSPFDGGDIFAQYCNFSMIMNNTKIINEVADNSISLEIVSFFAKNITIQSKFINSCKINLEKQNNSFNADQGGAIYCQDCAYFHLNDSVISGGRAKQGGSIYLMETETKKQLLSSKSVRFKMYNTVIKNSVAFEEEGGAMYLDNIQKMEISNLNLQNNYAVKLGGGIFISCQNPAYDCSVTFLNKNYFSNNSANISGGAFYWSDVEPKYQSLATQFEFKNNKATIYGDDIGSYSQKLIEVSEQQYKTQMFKVTGDRQYIDERRLLQSTQNYVGQTNSTIEAARSGSTLPSKYIALADKYGQIVGTANSAKLSISVSSNYKKSDYSPLLEGTTEFYSQNGVFFVQDIAFTGTPGLNYSLVYNTDGIDQNKPSNKEYKQTQLNNQSDINFQMILDLRECQVGEQFTDVGKCNECPQGQSFSLVKMNSPGQCIICPSSKAICNGGSQVGPKEGYWRKNNVTYVFIECFNEYACLGMRPPTFNPQGDCEVGYSGILCTECIGGYSRTGNFECSPCPDKSANSLRISAICLAIIIVVIFLIRSTLSGASDTRNVTSVYQKILLNHIQMLMVTASFNFNWPKVILNFFNQSKNVGQASEQILSFDCFIQPDQQSKDNQTVSSFYLKLLIFSVLPFLLFIVSYGFWGIQGKRLNDMKIVGIKGISTLVILLFLVHPNIVQFVFNAFNCITLDGEERMKQDLQELCYVGQHFFWAIGIALPALIVWGLGIPMFAFILLTREEKKLEKLVTRQKYGFLFRGYRLRFYYWEVIIMYRKIALIFISAFLVRYGVITQALVVFILLILFLFLNIKKSPFQTQALNQLETQSLVTSMISVYCGLYFIVNVDETDTSQTSSTSSSSNSDATINLDDDTLLFFFAIIIISNLVFICFWLYKFLQEINQMLIKKFQKVYTLICLCGDTKKFIEHQKQAIEKEISEGYREKYFDTLKNLKLIYNKGQLVLNDHNLEKIQIYLNHEKVFQIAGIDFDQRTVEQKEHDKRRQIIEDDEILKNLQQNQVIDDFLDDQERDYNNQETSLYNHEILSSQQNMNKKLSDQQFPQFTKENLLKLDNNNSEQLIFSQVPKINKKYTKKREAKSTVSISDKKLIQKHQQIIRSEQSDQKRMLSQNDYSNLDTPTKNHTDYEDLINEIQAQNQLKLLDKLIQLKQEQRISKQDLDSIQIIPKNQGNTPVHKNQIKNDNEIVKVKNELGVPNRSYNKLRQSSNSLIKTAFLQRQRENYKSADNDQSDYNSFEQSKNDELIISLDFDNQNNLLDPFSPSDNALKPKPNLQAEDFDLTRGQFYNEKNSVNVEKYVIDDSDTFSISQNGDDLAFDQQQYKDYENLHQQNNIRKLQKSIGLDQIENDIKKQTLNQSSQDSLDNEKYHDEFNNFNGQSQLSKGFNSIEDQEELILQEFNNQSRLQEREKLNQTAQKSNLNDHYLQYNQKKIKSRNKSSLIQDTQTQNFNEDEIDPLKQNEDIQF